MAHRPDDTINTDRHYADDSRSGSFGTTRSRRYAFSSSPGAGPARRFPGRLPYHRSVTTPYSIPQRLEAAAGSGCWGEAEEAKLSISNLHPRVTREDLEILFSELGELKEYSIHYDMRGNSLGTGEVVYTRKADAEAARNRYNGVKLDGEPMIIGFVGVNLTTSNDPSRVTGGAAHADLNILSGRCGKRGIAIAVGGRSNHADWGATGTQEHQSNQVRRRATVEELDADLDNYWISSANGGKLGK